MASKKRVHIAIHLDEDSPTPLYGQIYEQIRDAIFAGTIEQGCHLISIRRLAEELGVSHTTVEQSYLQLATEGLVANVPRSGYVIEHVDIEYLSLLKNINSDAITPLANSRNRDAFFAENRSGGDVLFDFSYANLQPGSFPIDTWRKLVGEVLYKANCVELSRYGYTDEPSSLSVQLAGSLARLRGVRCSPEQVFVQAGTDGALATVLQLFDRENDVLGMEEPGYATVHEVARRQGFRMVPLPTDTNIEAFFMALNKHKPRIVFTTPSHQFPTGRLLPLDARTRLLRWAEDNDAYIIEDDSCNEYRYATRPVPSLQSLDAYGRVIYLCNVSKVLSPALRVAYLVLPTTLLGRCWDCFNYAHPPVSWLTQEILARFIEQGHWDAHVRKTAKGNRIRHDDLLAHLRNEFGDMIEISGTDTGMHLYVTVYNNMSQADLLQRAQQEGAKVYGTSRMWFSKPAPENNVMIGFSAIKLEDIAPGVAALARAWKQ